MFVEVTAEQVHYMKSDKIGIPHAFTTRYGGVSEGYLSSLNLGERRGDRPENVLENYRRVGAIFGVGADDFAVSRQVHGTEVRIVSERDRHEIGSEVAYDADGLITTTPGLPIMVFIADCVPVLMFEPEIKIAAAVHCGWRSSVSDILAETVGKMEELGGRARNIQVAIGPSIGKDHFETDGDVPEALRGYLGDAAESYIFQKGNGKYLIDLRGANRERLIQLGLEEYNIDVSSECTMCSPEKYWSHRTTQGERGSQCAAIMLT